MSIFLSLGSNLGDRRDHLDRGLHGLAGRGVAIKRTSPIVESPALLPADAPADWNQPFLNLVIECAVDATPTELLDTIKALERELRRTDSRPWSPRPIDIDILLWNGDQIQTERLEIPHPALARRDFVLTPLAALCPRLPIPGSGKTPLDLAAELGRKIPLWMGIVNLTPDSFSDGDQATTWSSVETLIDGMVAAGVQIIDFGAESTRPGAQALDAAEEWSRLGPVLERVTDKFSDQWLRPLLSVDTYHPDVARRAIDLGVDVINDVSGLSDPEMIALAQASNIDWVAMHHLSIPASREQTLPTGTDVVGEVEHWLGAQMATWSDAGIDLERVIFDPGIGFGKNPLQSLNLLRNMERFQQYGLRTLVGHSRKSFMHDFAGQSQRARDLVTIGASMQLTAHGVDILRIHNVADHIDTYRGWAHAQGT